MIHQQEKSPHVDFSHSPDYRQVVTGGIVYFPTQNQAIIISMMHAEHQRGRGEVEGAWLLRRTDISCSRMGEVFRHSPAWKRLIVPGTSRGTYSLLPFVKNCNLTKNSPRNGNSRSIRQFIFAGGYEPIELLTFPVKRPKRTPITFCDPPLPSEPTHFAPCSTSKVNEMVKRRERGESLFHPEDFVPSDPIMIERYVFNGRRASAYKVAELLPASPRLTVR